MISRRAGGDNSYRHEKPKEQFRLGALGPEVIVLLAGGSDDIRHEKLTTVEGSRGGGWASCVGNHVAGGGFLSNRLILVFL